MITLYEVFDFFIYLLYSRRFYQHLKSREVEAKFFMDRDKYLENKYLCIHFKTATILVATALFIYNISAVLVFMLGSYIQTIPIYLLDIIYNSRWEVLVEILLTLPYNVCELIYRFLLDLNYLYVLFVIIYKYWKKMRNLTRVNDKIQPLVRDYQDQIYQRQYYI